MKKSNYDIMRDQAEVDFLNYDQEKIIAKFGLNFNDDHIYIKFISRLYQINRRSGKVQWLDERKDQLIHAGYNEVMTIFDVLCWSKEYCCLSGEYRQINDVPGAMKSATPGRDFFADYAETFAHKLCELSRACESLGGIQEQVGDVAYRINLFDFLPVKFQYWDSDEEFPAVLKIMWDKNIISYMHYETTYFAVTHLLDRIKENFYSQTNNS